MNKKSLNCVECEFKTTEAELFVQHIIDSEHTVPPDIHSMIKNNEEFRNELIASILAIQTANSPEEIGAIPAGEWNEVTMKAKVEGDG